MSTGRSAPAGGAADPAWGYSRASAGPAGGPTAAMVFMIVRNLDEGPRVSSASTGQGVLATPRASVAWG